MFVYAFIFIPLAALGIVYAIFRYIKRKITFLTCLLLLIAMSAVILFSIFPLSSSVFARAFGLARGLDFILILAILILIYIVGRMYLIIEDMGENINKLVKEIALNNEIKSEKDKK